jgi:uncharacterized lipoprotein YehR (DUF1307 family)
MRRIAFSLVLLVVLVAATFALTACGPKSVVGTWTYTSSGMKGATSVLTRTFKEDGTLTFSSEAKVGTRSFKAQGTGTYTYANSVLAMTLKQNITSGTVAPLQLKMQVVKLDNSEMVIRSASGGNAAQEVWKKQ